MALAILTPVNLARNAKWASDILLYKSEYNSGIQVSQIPYMLVGAHSREKNFSQATEICDRHARAMKKLEQLANRCGLAYEQLGRFDDAEQSFLLAMNKQKFVAIAHTNLARMYLHLGRREDAQSHFKLAIATESIPALREYHKAYMLAMLYPSDRNRLLDAKTHLEQALKFQPQLVSARRLLEQLNRILGSG